MFGVSPTFGWNSFLDVILAALSAAGALTLVVVLVTRLISRDKSATYNFWIALSIFSLFTVAHGFWLAVSLTHPSPAPAPAWQSTFRVPTMFTAYAGLFIGVAFCWRSRTRGTAALFIGYVVLLCAGFGLMWSDYAQKCVGRSDLIVKDCT